MELIKYFEQLYNKEVDLNETYFRLNHIISNFRLLYIENERSMNRYINHQVIFENKFYKGFWKQKLYIYNINEQIRVEEIDIQFNFVKMNKEDDFICLGQFVLDEYKNLIFIIQDNYFYSKQNKNDIQERIIELQKIFENHFIYSQLDVFVFKFIEYKYFTKENIEYLLKTTLLNNEIKISIESIEILNRYGNIIQSIECKHLIHLNIIEWQKFIEKNEKNIHFTIYKHSFDLNTNHNDQILIRDISNENKIYRLFTIKKGIDIYYIKTDEIFTKELFNNDDIKEQLYLVYIPDIQTSKYFNKLSNIENGFWFNYKYNSKLNKFIPVIE